MTAERVNEQEISPPKWWHGVLRNNYVGYQADADTFITPETELEPGVRYILHSFLSKGVKKEGWMDGIFIQLAIPESREKEATVLAQKIAANFSDFLKAELEKQISSEKELLELEPNPDFGGCMTKIDRKIAMNAISSQIDSPESKAKFPGVSNFLVSLVPADDELIKGIVKSSIREKFFLKTSFLNRIRFLGASDNRYLNIAILKEQANINSVAIKEMIETKIVARHDLDIIESDSEIQQIYWNLLRTIVEADTEIKMKNVTSEYRSLEPLLKAGFLEFNLNYWAKKLGIELPVNSP